MRIDEEALRSSLEAAMAKEVPFTRRFYEILFERHPEARSLFSRNFGEKQERMLQASLIAVLDHLDDAAWLSDSLGALGAKHNDYGVTDEMYFWVGDALLATLSESAGRAWSARAEMAWIGAIETVAELMMAGARRART